MQIKTSPRDAFVLNFPMKNRVRFSPPCLVIIPTIHYCTKTNKFPYTGFYSLAHSSVSIRSLITYGCCMLFEHCGPSYRSIVLSTIQFALTLFNPTSSRFSTKSVYIIRICEIWRPTVSGTRVWPS